MTDMKNDYFVDIFANSLKNEHKPNLQLTEDQKVEIANVAKLSTKVNAACFGAVLLSNVLSSATDFGISNLTNVPSLIATAAQCRWNQSVDVNIATMTAQIQLLMKAADNTEKDKYNQLINKIKNITVTKKTELDKFLLPKDNTETNSTEINQSNAKYIYTKLKEKQDKIIRETLK